MNEVDLKRKIIFSRNFDYIAPVIIFFFFLLFSVLLPSYNSVNGFYNKLFNNYQLTWVDGRSPSTFNVIKQLINTNSIGFPKGYLIDERPVELNYDFSEIGDKFYPTFNTYPHYFFAFFLMPFKGSSDLVLYKAMIFLDAIISALILSVFYLIQKRFGLKPYLSFMACLLSGIATSILIYSKYLFINDVLSTLFFMFFFYFLLKIKNNSTKNTRIDKLILFTVFTLFLLFTSYIEARIALFLFFSFYIYKFKIYNKIFPFILMFAILIAQTVYSEMASNSEPFKISDRPLDYYNEFNFLRPFFRTYGTYIPALDYSIYGYYNLTSTYKITRIYSFFYTFTEPKGNAIFAVSYNLFGTLFSEKGFIYNSVFLILSIFGIWIYKNNEDKNFLIFTILLFLIGFGLLNFVWYGGVTPRYVRSFDIPILLLTFFAFYFLQENSRNKLVMLVFLILAAVSILNVVSLTVREDWTYEHPADLVSYDLVLWPWVQPKIQTDNINLYFTNMAENVVWNYGSEQDCKAFGSLEGIVTYFCRCELPTYAERTITIPWNNVNVSFVACSRHDDRGNITGQLYFNNASKEFTISAGSCIDESFIANASQESSIVLRPKSAQNCTQEIVWKSIFIEKT